MSLPTTALYKTKNGDYQNSDVTVSIGFDGTLTFTIPEVGASFFEIYRLTCYRAPKFIKDITVKHNSLVATYVVGVPPFGTAPEHYGWGTASKATLEISGEALFVNRTATRFIRNPELEVSFSFTANLHCDPENVPFWKIREKLKPGDEQIDLGAEIGETGNTTVNIDEVVTTIDTPDTDGTRNETDRVRMNERERLSSNDNISRRVP